MQRDIFAILLKKKLLEEYSIAESLGHTVNKGTAREIFMKNFLTEHLSEKISVGSGEVISVNSKPGEFRNQLDIIIFKKEFPRIKIVSAIDIFLAESVVATIEVKSTLTKSELKKAIKSIKNIKQFHHSHPPRMSSGYIPKKILCFIVAYNCKQKLVNVEKWLKEIEKDENITQNSNINPTHGRIWGESNGVDGIFILGKGSVIYNNYHLKHNAAIETNNLYLTSEQETGSLLKIFLLLTDVISNFSISEINLEQYLSTTKLEVVE